MLQSSDRGAVRIQYSRNPFGRKRDFNNFSSQEAGGSSAAGGGGEGASPSPYGTPAAPAAHQPAQDTPSGPGFNKPPAAEPRYETAGNAHEQHGEAQLGGGEAQQASCCFLYRRGLEPGDSVGFLRTCVQMQRGWREVSLPYPAGRDDGGAGGAGGRAT